MSVYIPGIEMPKNCHECDSWGLSDVVMIDCPVDKDGSLYSYTDRPDGCPLVPVPEHGRLIEAGAIKNGIANCIYDDAFARGWNTAMKRILETVEDAPTIIPADKEGEG